MSAVIVGMMLSVGVARGDVITDWNDIALRAILATRQLPLEQTRSLALVHVSMFDAVNAIRRKYRPYKFDAVVAADASIDAAAASAARTVLLKLYPDQQDAIDINYATAMSALPDGASKTAGAEVGERAATAVLAARAGDTPATPNTYRLHVQPGVYVPTTLPVGFTWPKVRPWVLQKAAQFRPAPPIDLKSSRWARDYNEVKQLGGGSSTARTSEQSDVALFWVVTGPASWNPFVSGLALQAKLDVIANARLFALVNMAAMDGFIAVFDAKYTYNFWRPITAIRNGERDGNNATAADAAWLPLIDTPLHPEYPCAHCTTAGAVAAVLESVFGTGALPAVKMTSPTAPSVTRTWTRIADWVGEIDNARVWGGVHYRFSTEAGEALGRNVGSFAVANFLKPLP